MADRPTSNFVEGSTFSCFDAFKEAMEAFQKQTLTQFVTVSTDKLSEGDDLFTRFRYRVLRYECKQGQKHKQAKADKQSRPQQRSYKIGCPASMNVRLNRPKNGEPFLKVTKLNTNHDGHEVSREMFNLYPEQRRIITDEVDLTVLSAMTIKTSEQRQILENRHSAPLMRQDVYNLQRRMGVGKGNGERDDVRCEVIVRDIIAKGGHGGVGRDENGDFLYVTFQTVLMRQMLVQYPECLIMDCTYKVNAYLFPLLTIMVIDGEGHGIPVFHAFLAREDRFIMERCLRVFCQQFNASGTRCFIVDKDMAEIAAISAVFPGVPVNLCHFHISQAVERYLKKELGRGAPLIQVVLDSFMSQVNTESESEFHELRNRISQIVPQPVITYFEDNWWSKRHLWAACCNISVVRFHATTTNALESYHSKIKKIVNEKLSLCNVLSGLVGFNDSKIMEEKRKQVVSANCEVYDHRDQDVTAHKITKTMTRFGSQLVKHQLQLSRDIQYTVVAHETFPGEYMVSYRDRHHNTTLRTCTCSTYGHLQIPCRHIFATRRYMSVDVFHEDLVPDRFKQTLPTSAHSPALESEFQVSTVQSVPFSLRTVEGRYRKAKVVCDKAATFLSILGVRQFQEKLQELEDFVNRWCSVAPGSRPPSPAASSVAPGSRPPSPAASSVATGSRPPSPAASSVATGSRPPPAASSVAPGSRPSSPAASSVATGSRPSSPAASSVATGSRPPSPAASSVAPGCYPTPAIISIAPESSVVNGSLAPSVISLATPFTVSVDVHNVPRSVCDSFISEQGSSVMASSLPSPGAVSSSASSSWPTMNRLLKPRGRPGTKQRFTKLSSKRGQKRRRGIPRVYSSLQDEEKLDLLLSSVSVYNSKPSCLITCDEVKPVDSFADTVLDQQVDMSIIETFFESSAWELVVAGVDSRRRTAVWTCGVCKEVDNDLIKMVLCERCLIWYHFPCVRYSSQKEVETWFCDSCL